MRPIAHDYYYPTIDGLLGGAEGARTLTCMPRVFTSQPFFTMISITPRWPMNQPFVLGEFQAPFPFLQP